MSEPCKNCPDRYLGCHSNCDNYKKFKEEIAERKRKQQRGREYFNYLIDKTGSRKNTK